MGSPPRNRVGVRKLRVSDRDRGSDAGRARFFASSLPMTMRGRIIMAVSGLLAAASAMTVPVQPRASSTVATKLLMEELDLRCCLGRLELPPQLDRPWLVLQARPAKIEVDELRSMCDMLRATLDRREHFTVMWDLRQMRTPSREALRFSIDFMGEPHNTRDIDELVTSTIIIVCQRRSN